MPRRRCSSRSSTLISARSLASRLESGSSNSTTVGEMAHLHQVERALDIGLELFRALLSHAQAIGHVVEHRHVRPHGVGLEDHAHTALLGRDGPALGRVVHRLAVNGDAAAARLLEPGNGAQGRGLAAARRPQQGEMLAAAHREAHSVHRHLVAIAHDQVLHVDTRLAHVSSLVTPLVSRNRIASAATTVKVWISAIAAVSSVPLEAKAATIDGAITLALGPIRNTEAPSSRTQAMKISSHAASMPGLSSGRVTVRI